MGCGIGNNSLFGADKFIKFQGGDAIAVEGPNTVQRQMLNDLRFPYEQVLHSKIVLKAGQMNYLLNHLGLGDNATFLLIAARYSEKSRIEEDNYVKYNYYSDFARTYTFAQSLLLTGNSTNRVPQLYLTNPNATYSVALEVMVANIDDVYNYFDDVVNQSGTSFTGLSVTSIQSHIVGESIRIVNNQNRDLIYIQLVNINAIQLVSNIIVLNDNIIGDVFLQFISEEEAAQGFSLLNYILENQDIDIALLEPIRDLVSPVIYFNSQVGETGDWIRFMNAMAGVPYSTIDGNTFSTYISLDDFGGTQSIITKDSLLNLLVDYVQDNRDGTMSLNSNNINLYNFDGVTVSSIQFVGTYSLKFDLNDLALNNLSDVNFSLYIYEGRLLPDQVATIYFNSNVGNTGDFIYFNGSSASVPYSTIDGNTFSTTISYDDFSVDGEITKTSLIDLLVDYVVDKDGATISITPDNLILRDNQGNTVSLVDDLGTYSINFEFPDFTPISNIQNVNLTFNVFEEPKAYIYFNSQVDGDGDFIYFNGSSASVPYSSTDGNTFSTTISILDYNQGGEIPNTYLADLIVDYVLDNNDNEITLTSDNTIIKDIDGITISTIETVGTYSLSFDFSTYSITNTNNVNVEVYVFEPEPITYTSTISLNDFIGNLNWMNLIENSFINISLLGGEAANYPGASSVEIVGEYQITSDDTTLFASFDNDNPVPEYQLFLLNKIYDILSGYFPWTISQNDENLELTFVMDENYGYLFEDPHHICVRFLENGEDYYDNIGSNSGIWMQINENIN